MYQLQRRFQRNKRMMWVFGAVAVLAVLVYLFMNQGSQVQPLSSQTSTNTSNTDKVPNQSKQFWAQ